MSLFSLDFIKYIAISWFINFKYYILPSLPIMIRWGITLLGPSHMWAHSPQASNTSMPQFSLGCFSKFMLSWLTSISLLSGVYDLHIFSKSLPPKALCHMPQSSLGFLNIIAIDILGQIIFVCMHVFVCVCVLCVCVCVVIHRVFQKFSNVSSFYSLLFSITSHLDK